MNDDAQRTKLFRYLDERFATVDARFDAQDQRFDKLQSAVDGIVKVVDDQSVELAAVSVQLDRHKRWIHQLADRLGLKLKTGA